MLKAETEIYYTKKSVASSKFSRAQKI